jgi:hypothetical protein
MVDGAISADRKAYLLSPLWFNWITDRGCLHIQCSIALHMISYLSIDAGHRRVTEYHVTGIASWGLLGSHYTDLPVEARDASLSSA